MDAPARRGTDAWSTRFGGGVAAGYHQGRTIGGLNGNRGNLEDGQFGDYPVAKGYALAGSSLNVFGTHANDVVSAETMMMVKEHFIEEFGPVRWTIGSGRSGGSMQQHMIANNYPGLLDAIVPTASFADTMTFQTVDARLRAARPRDELRRSSRSRPIRRRRSRATATGTTAPTTSFAMPPWRPTSTATRRRFRSRCGSIR